MIYKIKAIKFSNTIVFLCKSECHLKQSTVAYFRELNKTQYLNFLLKSQVLLSYKPQSFKKKIVYQLCL